MGPLGLAQQIALAADCIAVPLDDAIREWIVLHGWGLEEGQRLVARQALLGALIRHALAGSGVQLFATPLDALVPQPPEDMSAAATSALSRASTALERACFWGELYTGLVPQPQRRRIGQFWTDPQVAEWMLAWLLQQCPRLLADAGCGAGNFLLAAQRLVAPGVAPALYGCDLSPLLLNVVLASCRQQAPDAALPQLEVLDVLNAGLRPDADAVVCNPPYTRHHNIPAERKDRLQAELVARFGLPASRKATMAFYFAMKLLADMRPGACGALIMPMEVFDARYGAAARCAFAREASLTAVIHFSPRMSAFARVDVGAAIALFRKGYQPANPVAFVSLDALPRTGDLLAAIAAPRPGRQSLPFGTLAVRSQDELAGVKRWFALATPYAADVDRRPDGMVVPLKQLARVMRGIATGANTFFALSDAQARELGLAAHLVRTLQRNREARGLVFDEAAWQALAAAGRRVWLLYLNGAAGDDPALGAYLAAGEARGVHTGALVQKRRRWYTMERRDVPEIFFTILTRGNPRFVLNRAEVRPLNMFALIYPRPELVERGEVELLWALLNSSFTLQRLHSVSRTYGGNTLKVEPRELEEAPVLDPRALAAPTRARLHEAIAAFWQHRQEPVLKQQVDALVAETLGDG